jgi:hypothetical protein
LYSMPHLSFTMTCLPVRSFRKGLGLTGTVCRQAESGHQRRRGPPRLVALPSTSAWVQGGRWRGSPPP